MRRKPPAFGHFERLSAVRGIAYLKEAVPTRIRYRPGDGRATNQLGDRQVRPPAGVAQRPLMGDLVMRNGLLWRLTVLFVAGAVGAPVEASPPSLEAAVRSFVNGDSIPSFSYALVDLNGDGQLDAIVLLHGPIWCGSGGCTMLVFRGTANGFQLVSKSTITSEPIKVLPGVAHGWRMLIVNTGGIGPVVMQFNGSRYPGNPSMQPKATSAQIKSGQRLNLLSE